ncbi:MAG: capsular biosynthesis protein [Vibrio sp.]
MNLLQLNTGFYLQVYALTTLVLCGLVQYFTGIGAVLWLPFLLACLMLLLLLMQTRYQALDLDQQEIMVLALFLGFFGMVLVSTLLQSGVLITIVGMKNELALSLILFCLLLGFCRESQIHRLVKWFDWIFYAQLPVIIFQVLVMVPRRVAIKGEFEKWDSVVGTFGGDPLGGGNTAAMGLFCLLIMLLKVSGFKHGVVSLKSMIIHVTIAFGLCVLGEIKFVILLAPMLLAMVWLSPSYIKGMKGMDLKVLLMIAVGSFALISIAITVLAAGYASAFGTDPTKSPLDIFIDSLSYIFDPNYIMESGELGRMTTIFFWLNNSDLYGITGTLFGYGLNSTNHGSSVAPGFLNIVLNVLLDSTSLSMLLWEVGIIGTLFFMALVFYILKICKPKPLLERGELSHQDIELVSYQAAFRAFGVACVLSLPYSQILMLTPMLQFTFYLSLGCALVIRKSVFNYARQV